MCLCLFFITLSFVGCNSANTENQLPELKPKDFNFIFNYGVNAKNQLDTTKGQFTKDMVLEPSITTNLKLSDDEMNTIYLEMKKINILNYSDKFNPKSNTIQTPFSTYSIKIIVDGKEKSIYWKDENVSQSKEATQLRNLFKKIQEIIVNKEEFKKLPEPKSAYQ
ncbi:hypothetical protein JK636_04815 [Clostridium sp. YIM B02515]|uniref:DUF4825 domain-containing protein n=2 Tax=Clostridium rhizosphaerae TaxID=2803861 RepID=A0ABS1T8G7_9CLOT|nr:hypothetical protein [Clostridium rhizosphaerae]MBL4935077.1 hypothetical protein [Clostridium rhizosphaerae]